VHEQGEPAGGPLSLLPVPAPRGVRPTLISRGQAARQSFLCVHCELVAVVERACVGWGGVSPLWPLPRSGALSYNPFESRTLPRQIALLRAAGVISFIGILFPGLYRLLAFYYRLRCCGQPGLYRSLEFYFRGYIGYWHSITGCVAAGSRGSGWVCHVPRNERGTA